MLLKTSVFVRQPFHKIKNFEVKNWIKHFLMNCYQDINTFFFSKFIHTLFILYFNICTCSFIEWYWVETPTVQASNITPLNSCIYRIVSILLFRNRYHKCILTKTYTLCKVNGYTGNKIVNEKYSFLPTSSLQCNV